MAKEFGVWRFSDAPEDGPHRGPMTEGEARVWVAECVEMGIRPGAFWVVERDVSSWMRSDAQE